MRYRTALLAALLSAAAGAQPTINANGVVNAASATPAGLPNSSVAQGSIFSIYGRNLGPFNSPALSWPLREELGGVRVRIQPDGALPVYAILLYVSRGQINAVLPSSTPVGNATATVVYNDVTGNAVSFTVVRSSVGLFNLNPRSGSGVIQNYHTATPALNSIAESAIPGDVAVLWAVGLGPVSYDEKNPPVQTDLGVGAEVWAGGVQADTLYQGRSTFAGVDQINFVVPDVPGCYVPVYVKAGGVISNVVTMSIARRGGLCQDSSLAGLDPDSLVANGLRKGTVTLTRTLVETPQLGMLVNTTTDSAVANFVHFDWPELLVTRGELGVSVPDACTVFNFTGTTPPTGYDVDASPLDAGSSLSLLPTGPGAVTKTITRKSTGSYSVELSKVTRPGGGLGQTDYFSPGENYQVTGPGGAKAGAFSAAITLPSPPAWVGFDSLSTVRRIAGLTIRWTGGAGMVAIAGHSAMTSPQQAGAAFVCLARAFDGTFTVPADILSALPASGSGVLTLSETLNPVPFQADGLDAAALTAAFHSTKNVIYE
jgi:uncharacterized protein (TIGR03437 family)